ncbi:MAG TPA: class I SAM-dependent RNA methyltransferase [Spirochaetes bacterium]|mgnify:CR=1 FL=1|nr:class I SAM-dependent RNA methyltransferase [Spirochaetota bacterium]
METVKLTIEKAVYGGYGLGRSDGKVIFVPCTLPGDCVETTITAVKKDFSYGTLLRIITPSKERTAPDCPNFAVCGGCDYLHCSYETELRIKKSIVVDSLLRTARLKPEDLPEIAVMASARYGYRSHATVKRGGDGTAGFFRRDSTVHVPFPEKGCLLLSPVLIEALRKKEEAAVNEFRIAHDHEGAVYRSDCTGGPLREIEQGIIYDRDISCFFQANRLLRSHMLAAAGEYGSAAEGVDFIDLACGVGFFALYLGALGAEGTGVDIDRKNIRWALHNGKINRAGPVGFVRADIARVSFAGKNPGLIIADPPRAGLSLKTRSLITHLGPGLFVYVSCDPATFSRDLRHFLENGYRLARLALLDMFPGTYHIELMARLER